MLSEARRSFEGFLAEGVGHVSFRESLGTFSHLPLTLSVICQPLLSFPFPHH